MMTLRSDSLRLVIGVLLAVNMLVPGSRAQLAPRLQIQRAQGAVHLQWPVGDGLFGLEERASLASDAAWQPTGQTPRLATPFLELELVPSDHTRFFRLRQVTQPEPGIVPDPEGQATVPPPNMAQSFADSTSFLYSGTNSVQIGVAAGTIDSEHASVLRGRVIKRDHSPLPGVHVRVLHHPELGFTYTRADGMFDLAVNGGPQYTLEFQSRGYCPVQRQVNASVQNYRSIEDVILITPDPVATPVNFGTTVPLQTAKSSVNTDKAGSRSAMVLFPPGTCATVLLPDGSTQNCAGLTIRATEFTVGPDGPKAMPGPLPPASAYTYAVSLTGDEAVAAGAKTIQFNQTVNVYVDNFLELPTGTFVPSAYYDRDLAAWVPQSNGLVMKLLAPLSGTAQIDLNGDDVPETTSVLDSLGFTSAELQHLAANYAAGKTLWRMPVQHFTDMDFNLAKNPADRTKPNKPGDRPNGNGDSADGGGEINLTSQVFTESIPLVGAGMALHYSSARVPGYRVGAELHLPLISKDVPFQLKKVRVDMEVAGRLSEFEYPAQRNTAGDFAWDGLDAYGRQINESEEASFKVFYLYPLYYSYFTTGVSSGRPLHSLAAVFAPPTALLFGLYGNTASTITHNEVDEAKTILFSRVLTIPDQRRAGLGGWSLTPHHRYDPVAKILYLGDGRVQRPGGLINGVSGSDLNPSVSMLNIAGASDGTVFLAEQGGRIYRTTPKGELVSLTATLDSTGHDLPGTIVVSGGGLGAVDGKPASQVRFNQVSYMDMKVGPDDSLYLRNYGQIVRLTPDGVFHVVLGGTTSSTFPEDGSVARNVSASFDLGYISVGADNTVYYSDLWATNGQSHDYVRKIAPDGRIYTLIGSAGRAAGPFETQYFTGGPAAEAKTAPINGLAAAPDGALYIAGGVGMVRITPGGIVEEVMNGAALSLRGSEGMPAESTAPFRPGGLDYAYFLQVGPDGRPYFISYNESGIIWKVDENGLFQRVAGKVGAPYESDRNPLDVQLGDVRGFTVDRMGAITILSQPPGQGGSGGGYSVRRIGPAFPGFTKSDLRIASREGGEIYIFNEGGLHLATISALTGSTNWLFTYNSMNLLTDLRGPDGLVTRLERDATGKLTAIVGPYGQRTQVTLDSAGYLATVTDPSGASTVLTHTALGLCTSIAGPRTNTFAISYDEKGRSIQMNDPAGGFVAVDHTDLDGPDFSTLTTTATGDETTRVLQLFPDGSSTIQTTLPDKTIERSLHALVGGTVQTNANGTVYRMSTAADPRFPGQTEVVTGVVFEFPNGLQSAASYSRQATLLDKNNPLSLVTFETHLDVNGQRFIDSYDAATRRLTSITPEGRTNLFEFDAASRLVLMQSGADAPIRSDYDASGRLSHVTQASGGDESSRAYVYNTAGLVDHISDELGQTIRFTYDDARRMRQFIMPDGATAEFEFDSEAHMTGVTPPGRPKHQFRYNSVGSLAQYTPPVVSTDDSVRFEYDAARNLTNIAMPDGRTWSMTRGPGGWPRHLVSSEAEIFYNYNPATGQLSSMTNNAGDALFFEYSGSLPVLTRWSGSVTGQVAVEFDLNLKARSYSVNGESIGYRMNRDGSLTQAGDLNITRDPVSGRVVAREIGVLRETFAYDEMGHPTNTFITINGAPFSEVALRYDRISRLTNRIETINGARHSYDYHFNLAGRLTGVRRDGASLSTYTYDLNGNRVSRNGESATYDAQDRLLTQGSAVYSWSRNGYRTGRSAGGETTTYDYDVQGKLLAATRGGFNVRYILDPIGRRIGRQVNGTTQRGWLYLDQRIVAELDGASRVISRFVYADGSLTPALMLRGEDTYFLVADERGSVRHVINVADGTVLQTMEYDEFGRVLADTNPGFQPFGFTGGVYDSDTGLVRLGQRDYDAETGQWTARDPIGFQGKQFSLYAYVRNDPVNFFDPTGTGPFGFLRRNRDSAIDAMFDGNPGNNERLQGALDRYDNSVKAAVITGQALVTTGQLINSVMPGPRGPASTIESAAVAGERQAVSSAANEAVGDAVRTAENAATQAAESGAQSATEAAAEASAQAATSSATSETAAAASSEIATSASAESAAATSVPAAPTAVPPAAAAPSVGNVVRDTVQPVENSGASVDDSLMQWL